MTVECRGSPKRVMSSDNYFNFLQAGHLRAVHTARIMSLMKTEMKSCNIVDTASGETVATGLSKRSANAVVKAMAEGRCGNAKGLQKVETLRVVDLLW